MTQTYYGQPQPPSKPAKSKTLLIIGGILLGLALLSLIGGALGMRSLKAGAQELVEQAENRLDENNPDRIKATLTVPGETTCTLVAKRYVIWVQQPPNAGAESSSDAGADPTQATPATSGDADSGTDQNADDEDAGTTGDVGFDFDSDDWDETTATYQGPPVEWSVTGPDGADVFVSEGDTVFFDEDEIAIASFEAEEDGEYTIKATGEGNFDGFEFTVFDDITEEQLEALGQNFGKAAGGFLMMLGGFLGAGLFGLIGLILVIVYLAS